MNELHYKAFVSYSHQNETWAAGLHKALETYRLPKKLVGTNTPFGPVPEKLYPVFRDREELSSATDLSERVQAALKESDSLVIVCSPAAAASKWVNEEIRHFKSLGRGDRIYCMIVDGDPQSTDPAEACFPPALFESDNGEVHEPLAADARKWADGKTLAKLKLVAAILGVRLNDLRRREQLRQRRRQLLIAVAAVLVIALGTSTVVSHLAEKSRKDHAEALVSELVQVSAGLDDVVDLQTLRNIGERLAGYLDTLDPKDLSSESRLQVGLVLRQLGEVSRSQGRPEEAMDAFQRSRAALAGLVEDAPDDLNALFELGQAEFWVGYIYLDQGRWDEATKTVKRYFEVSKSLFEAEPENAEWAMEMAYATSNLGTIESRRVPVDYDQVLNYMQSAMEYNQLAAELDPADSYYQFELSETHANLADAWLEVCNLDGALSSRESNVAFAADFYRKEPNNNRLKSRYAYSLAGLAAVQQMQGHDLEAMAHLQQSVTLLTELAREDPSNLTYRWNLHRKTARIAHLLDVGGQAEAAWSISADVETALRQLEQEDQSVNVVNATDFAVFLLQYADLAHRRGDATLANKWFREGVARLQKILSDRPDSNEAQYQLRMAAVQYWQLHGQRLASDGPVAGHADTAPLAGASSCNDLSLLARLHFIQGEADEARALTTRLLDQGFREPSLMRFCSTHGLCGE